jgi:hypothetical protein
MQGVNPNRKIPAHGRHQEPVRNGFDGYLDLAYKLANMSFRRFFTDYEDLTQAARLVALEAYNELGDGQILNIVWNTLRRKLNREIKNYGWRQITITSPDGRKSRPIVLPEMTFADFSRGYVTSNGFEEYQLI